MKFIVERTSQHYDDTPPCDRAVLVPHIYVDERTIDDPMKNQNIGAAWYETGSNHRVENGHIMRDFPDKAWTIEMASLEELIALAKKEGELVISFDREAKIEIYDTCRE